MDLVRTAHKLMLLRQHFFHFYAKRKTLFVHRSFSGGGKR
jgi:hypothetical protein